jgi:hypothetical protein
LRRKQVAGDHQDDHACDQSELACQPMRCPRRQEAAPGELVGVRDARHTYKTAADRFSFRVRDLMVVRREDAGPAERTA